MKCVFCDGAKMNCMDSREVDNVRRRRYVCENCGEQIYTEEVVVCGETRLCGDAISRDKLMEERRKSFEFGLAVGRRMGRASFSDGGENG